MEKQIVVTIYNPGGERMLEFCQVTLSIKCYLPSNRRNSCGEKAKSKRVASQKPAIGRFLRAAGLGRERVLANLAHKGASSQ
jgi:hypothetical protein